MKVVGEIKFRRAIATLYFPFDVAELALQQGFQYTCGWWAFLTLANSNKDGSAFF